MEDLTIGGLCMGLGMETNSHRFGLLQETVLAFEIITSHGDLLRVTKEDNPELFYALPWSHGTLGFLVAVELKIIPIKPYVHIQYIPCHSKEELCRKMQELAEAEAPPQFLEATVYSKETSVIMVGTFAEVENGEKRKKVNGVNYFWKPWYYLHVQEALGEKGGFDEYVPVRHYHHRFTRSVFWELRDLIPFGNEAWYRYLFGWLGAPKVSFIKVVFVGVCVCVYVCVFEGWMQGLILDADALACSSDLFLHLLICIYTHTHSKHS
jgi:delta24-sterol reductase